MSAVKDYATRCGRDVDESAKKINGLNNLYDELSTKFQMHGSEVAQSDLDDISRQITAEKENFTRLSELLERAVAALLAENKLEKELADGMQSLGR
jgi:DNA-binding transcriptional regulator GbsR (MarR family)